MHTEKQPRETTQEGNQSETPEKENHFQSNETTQCRFSDSETIQKTSNKKTGTETPNRTGMPDRLKSGLENLSGYDLSSVKVHYNSPKPQQIGALAYTQGTNIHVGPGQQKHLPHEGWHAVQQLQGRVKQTTQMKEISINDSPTLEKEADTMGHKASSGSSEKNDSKHNRHLTNGPLTKSNYEATQRHVIQRAIGMEFECSHLVITNMPDDSHKGSVIEENVGRQWKMTVETTSEGTPVVEFIVEPAAETQEQLENAVTDMAGKAGDLNSDEPTVTNGYTIKKTQPIQGDIQITMGTPLSKIPIMFEKYRVYDVEAPSIAYKIYKKLVNGQQFTQTDTEDKVFNLLGCIPIPYQSQRQVTVTVYQKAPDGTNVPDLSNDLKGFILILMDCIRSGHIPAEYRGAVPQIVFVKSIYQAMPRTNFKAMYDALPNADKDKISESNIDSGERQMKADWWKWLIKISLDKDDLSEDSLLNDIMINQHLRYQEVPGAGPKRSDFLKQLPERDLLAASRFMGVGALGNRADVAQNDNTNFAPIFELRKPYGASVAYDKWVEKATESWQTYLEIVGERFNIGGQIQ